MRNARRWMTRSLPRRAAIAAVAAAAVVASAALPHAAADVRGRRADLDVARVVELTDLVREAAGLADGTALPPVADRAVHSCPLPAEEPCPATPPSLAADADRVLDGIAAWLNFVERLREFLDSLTARV